MEQLAYTPLKQVDADYQNQHGNHQSREIFVPSVPIGMLHIRRLAGHFKAQQADDAGGGVGQVIDRIRGDRDGAC